jgi:hypothetical protein
MSNALTSFAPNSAATATVACTTTSGSTRVALVGALGDSLARKQCIVQSAFDSPATAFIEFGTSAGTAATTTGFPVAPGAILCLTIPAGATHVIGITAASTATVYVTTGEGA